MSAAACGDDAPNTGDNNNDGDQDNNVTDNDNTTDNDNPTDNGPVCVCTTASACCDGCAFINQGGPCTDGLFCNGTETCTSGVCGGSTGDPCSGPDADDDCSETCDETADDCNGDDGNGEACSDGIGCTTESCSAGVCTVETGCPIFVKSDATGANNGSSWADAFTTLQDGVDLAVATTNPRVFVSSGTYLSATPTEVVLAMGEGVSIYGSFAGTENTLEERPTPTERSSLLDGQNLYRVVTGASNARLDAFTVTNGRGQDLGGGMYNGSVVGLTIADCEFSNNTVLGSSAFGGAVAFENSTASVTDVRFSNNDADASSSRAGGAGAYCNSSTLTFTDVAFLQNSARAGNSSARGGGVYVLNGTASFDRVVVQNNSASARSGALGGGVYALGATTVTLNDVKFAQNSAAASSASAFGGGLALRSVNAATLNDVRFVNNSVNGFSSGYGGGMDTRNSGTTLTDVSFTGNNVYGGHSSSSSGGGHGWGSGLHTAAGNATLTDVRFSSNVAGGYSGGRGAMVVDDSTLTMTNGSFFANDNSNGGLLVRGVANVAVRFSSFYSNGEFGIFIQGGTLDVAGSAFFSQNDDIISLAAATTSVTATCAQQDLSAFDASNVAVTVNPFALSSGNDLFLAQDGDCIDASSNASADTAYGVDAWRTLTTDLDGAIVEGASVADPGVHRSLAQPWIKAFGVSGATVSWTTNAPPGGTCTVTSRDIDPYQIPESERASGTLQLEEASGSLFTIECVSAGHRATASFSNG